MSQNSQGTEVLSQGTAPLSPNNFNAPHATPIAHETPHKTHVTWRNETPSSLKNKNANLFHIAHL